MGCENVVGHKHSLHRLLVLIAMSEILPWAPFRECRLRYKYLQAEVSALLAS